jgi:hypothetical protein
MIAPHKCFLTTYLLIAQFVEEIVNLQEIKKNLQGQRINHAKIPEIGVLIFL